MLSAGYTLIELLIVITIIAILTVVGFVNFKDFSTDQISTRAMGQIQSLLRLAQSNATSSTLCNGVGGTTWSLIFKTDQQSIDLTCGATNPPPPKSYRLENNAKVDSIMGSNCASSILTSTQQTTLTYSSGVGALTITADGTLANCLASPIWTFTIKNPKNDTLKFFKISKGGGIDVQ